MVGTASNHEHDPRWTAVDHYGMEHLLSSTQPYAEALKFAESNAEKNGLPDIAVSAFQGKFLALQCKLINAKHILEVGTLGGYSSIWFASIAPDVRVTTLEVNEHHTKVAQEAVDHAGLTDRIEIILGSAIDTLPKLKEEVDAGGRQKWDFVFIDADKINNWPYLNHSVAMTRSNGLIVVDNVVRRGYTADAARAETDQNVRGSRLVIEQAGKDERIDSTLMQTVGEKNYDGFLLCVVK